MAQRKAKRFKVIQNPELVEALKGFMPAFGSDEDLNILTRSMNLSEKLEMVDNTILRGDPDRHTKKMKDILFEERGLIASIIRRNMDF